MPAAIAINVLTQEGVAVADEAVSVVAPGGRGYVGMLRSHAPMVTTIAPGRLAWTRPDGTRRQVQVGSGLLEIARNRCTMFVSSITDTAK